MAALTRGGLVPPFLLSALLSGTALAQPAPLPPDAAVQLPDIVVTADRKPEPTQRVGSAISVLTRDQIRTFNPTSLVDTLRDVPGVDVSENGGPGGTTSVRIRGANSGQTLVLIDGIRVNDPAAASGDFDFASLLPTAIDRIEVLRGPQSALYGSDAIGGVVNIITRQGSGTPHFEARTEAGSYGTLTSSASAFGSTGPWSYAFNAGGTESAGFSRYGYRIGRLEARFPRFEPDGLTRYGGYGRFGYDAGEGVKLEAGVLSFKTNTQYDAGSGSLQDTPASAQRLLSQIWGRATAEQGPLTHTLRVSLTETDRSNRDFSFSKPLVPSAFSTLSEFRGDRYGTEYQGNLALGTFGSLIFGGKFERERADTFSTAIIPAPGVRTLGIAAQQDTRALFALYELPVGDRLVLSAGGRHDEVNAVEFDTWRATAAFLIPETGTKLRASGGTGGKAPTLYQLFSIYGVPALQPERSIGWDAGVDQTLFDGRVELSATVFGNRLSNLIDFNATTLKYFNVTRADTSGVEIEGKVVVVPEFLRITGAYTYLHAQDLSTRLTLARRPGNVGRIGFQITALPNWLIEPRVTLVSTRFSGSGETLPLAAYARLDLYSEYKINDTFRVFGRIENVTNTHYQEVYNYGTTGRAYYAGLNVTW